MTASASTHPARTSAVTAARIAALVVGLSLSVAGCMSRAAPEPAPLVAAPTAPIQRAELPPAAVAPPPIAQEPLPPAPSEQVASVDPALVAPAGPGAPPAALNVSRTDLLGRWTLSSGGDSCDIFMSLTTWTGGYRASTRGCSSPSLAGISAWELSGRTVTLKGGDGGGTVASLSAAEASRFAGSTSDGAGITFSR